MSIDSALHVLAWSLLQVCSPERAHRLVVRLGRILPQYASLDAVRSAEARLRRRGTCLTRSLALTARVPRSEVVIGILPKGGGLVAHAWLEVSGIPMNPDDPKGDEIVRLSRHRSWNRNTRHDKSGGECAINSSGSSNAQTARRVATQSSS